MGIAFHKKPYLIQYQVSKKLDVQDFLWPETLYLTYEIFLGDVHVILTSLTSLNERKKTHKKPTNKQNKKTHHSQKELQAIISTMFNCCLSNISATVE